MNRRTFLASTLGLSLSAWLAGCQARLSGELVLAMLQQSVPPQLLRVFQRQMADQGRMAVVVKNSLADIFALLQDWQRRALQAPESPEAERPQANADVPTTEAQTPEAQAGNGSAQIDPTQARWVTQTDFWLAAAIQQELIQPIATESLDRWEQLPGVWPQLVRRDRQGFPADAGPVWGIPYRWTALAILYDRDRLPQGIQGWNDLLQPDLTQRLLLPDHPRLVLGLGLKALGTSANQLAPDMVPGLEDFLAQLHRQVRWYNSEHTFKALITGGAIAVVGWLDAMLPLARRYRNLAIAIPAEGTLTSADLWVQPSHSPPDSPLANQWLNFCLSDDFSEQLAIYGQGLSPWRWAMAANAIPEPLQTQADLFTDPDLLARSDFLMPLPAEAQAQYDALWQRMRLSHQSETS